MQHAIGDPRCEHKRASKCTGFLATFVRHPLDRFVSAFEFLRDPKWRQCVIPQSVSFREFVLGRQFETADTLYFKPMDWWLDAPVDFVGRFENLAADFERLCRLLGFKQPIELPRMRIRGGLPWQSAYDDETRAIVADVYRDDCVRFGYGA